MSCVTDIEGTMNLFFMMHPVLMETYANMTQPQCQAMVNSCEQCQKKKARNKKGIVVKVD